MIPLRRYDFPVTPQSVLLVAGDRATERVVRAACETIGARLTTSASASAASSLFADRPPDAALGAMSDFEEIRRVWPTLCVLILAERGESEQMIEAIKRGAVDSLTKPLSERETAESLRAALRISRDIHIPTVYEPAPERANVDAIIGQSPAMQDLYKAIGLIAPRDINVLIVGESGTGKELVARAILQHSARRGKPYLAVNCAAIPETLLESELFGHEKGAFTGADRRRIGKFEQCHRGTIFLDEVGDIPLPTQAKLLRVLQDRSFQRLGGTDTIHADVRIIAATHQPLEEMIEQRAFRHDLYYRLNVASVRVPPLREREVDAVLLAHYFAARFGPEMGAAVQSFSPELLPVLLNYHWPGNVRELENAIRSALVLARASVLRPEHLPEPVRRGLRPTSGPLAIAAAPPQADAGQPLTPDDACRRIAGDLARRADLDGVLHQRAIEMIERSLLSAVLTATRGNAAAAARKLGISRTTLRRKMSELGIEIAAGSDRSHD